ncbi:MAG: hypothetical protein WCD44_02305 [Candidatus Babeliales bacterium]
MKKVITKTLLVAFLFSITTPYIAQANVVSSFIDKASELNNYSAIKKGLFYGKRTALAIGVGALIYGTIKADRWWRSTRENNYRELYDLFKSYLNRQQQRQPQDTVISAKKAVELFENSATRKCIIAKWSFSSIINFMRPAKKIEYINGFIKYCKSRDDKPKIIRGMQEHSNNRELLSIVGDIEINYTITAMAKNYLEYLQKPWILNRDLISFALGGMLSTTILLKEIDKTNNK